MKNQKIILLLIACFSFGNCSKNSQSPPVSLLTAYLIDGPWQLTASYQYNSAGFVVSKTTGSAGDSIIFASAPSSNLNVSLTNLISFIGGSKNYYSYDIYNDSMLPISPVWKIGYSDTLFLVNFTDKYLTFKVKKIADPYVLYELDSLKKIRFY
jgi:hypothetical protein